MYPASVKFHEAAQSESPKTRVLLRFGDTLLTNEDINLESGDVVKLVEDLIPREERELTIGITPSSVLTATINNDHRLLDSFDFGPCTAQLAAMTESGGIAYSIANCMTVMRFGANQELRFEGWSSRPYLTINGYAPTAQPPWAVHSILTVGNGVYCFAPDGEAWKATWVDGRIWSMLTGQTWDETATSKWDDIQGVLVPATALESWKTLEPKKWDEMRVFTWNSFIDLPDLNPFMRRKAARWAADRRGMSWNADVLHEFWADGSYEKYEYVKLGVFNVDTPKKRKVQLISIVGHDHMRKFDTDATDFWNSLTWPISLGSIFTKLCQFVGVPQATISFINSTRMYAEKPTELDQVSAREILGRIAEAACSIARMTRDGGVELAWFTQQPVVFNDGHWFSADIAEYSVSRIDKLQVKSAQNDIGVIVGDTGKNAYVTLDNPFLYGSDDYDIRVAAVPIYNRLTAFPDFSPISTRVRTNWALQAGDIVSFDLDGQIYQLPIYSQSITWNGKSARAEIQNTGEPLRPAVNAQNRRVFAQKRAMHILEVTVDGFKSQISDIEGNVAEVAAYAKSITLSVANDSTSSTIELRANGAAIASEKIEMKGLVSFTNLSTPGQTTINGGNISTGTIDASKATITNINAANISTGKLNSERIDVDTLQVKHLNGADGTFSGTLSAAGGSFSGKVTANEGAIAGFTLSNNSLTSPSLTVKSSGELDFGGYAKLYSVSGAANLQAYSSLGLDSPRIELGSNIAALSVRNDYVYLHPSSIPQSGGGNMYLAWNQSSGQVLYSTPSSKRYKENIKLLEDFHYDWEAFEPVIFNYIFDDSKRINIGFIAEKAVTGCPWLGVTRTTKTGEIVLETIDMPMMIPILFHRIKRLESELSEMKKVAA